MSRDFVLSALTDFPDDAEQGNQLEDDIEV